MNGVLAWLAPLIAGLHDLPLAIIAPLFTFLGVIVTVIFGSRALWNIEKKRELRQHRRQLIAQWQTMVSDVSAELNRWEQAGTRYDLSDVLRVLEGHVTYASFKANYDRYSHTGIHGIRTRFVRLWLHRKLPLWKPTLQARPERTVMAGSHLPARLHLTIKHIDEIERWWKLH